MRRDCSQWWRNYCIISAVLSARVRLLRHRRRSSFTNFFVQKKKFIPPFLCILRAFSEGLSVRELRTQSWNEEAQREIGWELAENFCFYVTNPVPIFFLGGTKAVTNSCHEIAPKFFSPCFPAPKNPRQIHATFGAKIHANFGNFFSQWFLWVLDPGLRQCFWMPIFLC